MTATTDITQYMLAIRNSLETQRHKEVGNEGWKKICHANTKQNIAGADILI